MTTPGEIEETNQNYCPCGGIILADTEEWEIPLCANCYEEQEKE